jgi:hypothetical protein
VGEAAGDTSAIAANEQPPSSAPSGSVCGAHHAGF